MTPNPTQENTPAKNSQLQISTEKLTSYYSNFVRGLMTNEEIFLDFGLNPNASGPIVDEPADLRHRIVLSIPSAVRLHQLLQDMLLRRQQQAQQATGPSNPAKQDNPS